ncbi:MAG: glycosyl transferase [Chloroflexi bacterium]|nr:glycosyl transferase [Chloroflexota bacterium]
MTAYGYFDDANREYVITNPRTPLKWINYVGTLAFGGFVDHTGGSLICKGDPAVNRIVKYIPQLPAGDFKGETLYIRYRRGERAGVFSPYFVPTLDPYDRYECHVGLGYTRLVSEFYGIRTEVTVFVPHGDQRLVRDIRITNIGTTPVDVDAVPVVEYTHFDALKQFNNADWVPQTMQSKAHWQDGNRLVLAQYAFMNRGQAENLFTSNLPVSSFDSDRRAFLGENEYATWANPRGLSQLELNNSEALRGDNIGALLHHLGTLQPGETERLITQLTQAPNVDAALPGIRTFWDEAAVDAALDTLTAFWDEYLAALQVETPNTSMNSMLNVHHPRQCFITKNWSRYLSLYQLGLGARGIGFRDSSQDILGVLAHMPEEARTLMTQILHVQKRDGSGMHQYNPLTMIATVGDSGDDEDRPKYYGDDHLWIILAVCGYIKETGNFAYLDEVVPFYDKDRDEQPIESSTVLEHMRRGIEFTRSNVGAHGLPLLGFADWNDTVNLPTGAESLFIANLYGAALRELIELCQHLDHTAEVEKYQGYYDEMAARVNEHAWDGAWYVRYFTAEGQPIGSHTNDKGQFYTNAQSWAVLSGFATRERAQMALDQVHQKTNTRNGIKVSVPGYDGYDPEIGGISTFPPGAKENGGIFLHINPWVMIAETLLGNGDRAFQYYDQINPAAKNDKIDEYECEPYVYAQNILSDEHPRFGAARNSWLSGTAAWVYRAATQYILGVQPTYAGLRIDPCIPRDWEGFRTTRVFRGATLNITVQNPHGVSKGVQSVTVDGQAIQGQTLPLFETGTRHEVVVVLG